MNFLAAAYIDVKKGQDRADYVLGSHPGMILCDGIGSLAASAKYAEYITDEFRKNPMNSIQQLAEKLQLTGEEAGGTTVLKAILNHESDTKSNVNLECLGNGSVIHLTGHFNAARPQGATYYRYTELFLSHTDTGTGLVRHVSSDSDESQQDSTLMSLSLNHPYGDILLLFTDGISSSEERFVVESPDGKIWRNESSDLHLLLSALDKWLQELVEDKQGEEGVQDKLLVFIKGFLKRMKADGNLEDDLSLGVILTKRALETQRYIATNKQKDE